MFEVVLDRLAPRIWGCECQYKKYHRHTFAMKYTGSLIPIHHLTFLHFCSSVQEYKQACQSPS